MSSQLTDAQESTQTEGPRQVCLRGHAGQVGILKVGVMQHSGLYTI